MSEVNEQNIVIDDNIPAADKIQKVAAVLKKLLEKEFYGSIKVNLKKGVVQTGTLEQHLKL